MTRSNYTQRISLIRPNLWAHRRSCHTISLLTCCVDKLSCRRNALSTMHFFDEVSCRQNACRPSAVSTKCLIDELFSTIFCRRSVFRQKFVDQQHSYRFLDAFVANELGDNVDIVYSRQSLFSFQSMVVYMEGRTNKNLRRAVISTA